jgi:hypothetical protein
MCKEILNQCNPISNKVELRGFRTRLRADVDWNLGDDKKSRQPSLELRQDMDGSVSTWIWRC